MPFGYGVDSGVLWARREGAGPVERGTRSVDKTANESDPRELPPDLPVSTPSTRQPIGIVIASTHITDDPAYEHAHC
jgi:hypothetical protein